MLREMMRDVVAAASPGLPNPNPNPNPNRNRNRNPNPNPNPNQARRLERRVRELAAARAATLLPVAGRGFSYEFELRATSELQPEWCT